MKKYIIFVLLNMFFSLAYAEHFVCPNTFKTVMTGYTQGQVAALCGNPTSVAKSQTEITQPSFEEQWIYSVNSANPITGFTHAPQLIVSFVNGRVVSIAVNNAGASTVFTCYAAGTLRPGLSANQVQSFCGAPTFVDNYQRATTKTVALESWVYNFGAYKPTMIFIFENGTLTQIKMGPLGK